MRIFFAGSPFTDAGGIYIGPDGKIHRVPGWNPEAISELGRAVSILGTAVQLKNPALAHGVTSSVLDFAQKELKTHMEGGGVLVLR